MARIVEITDIPADKIAEVEKVFHDDGATTQRIPTGETFTVIATYPTESKAYPEWVAGGG